METRIPFNSLFWVLDELGYSCGADHPKHHIDWPLLSSTWTLIPHSEKSWGEKCMDKSQIGFSSGYPSCKSMSQQVPHRLCKSALLSERTIKEECAISQSTLRVVHHSEHKFERFLWLFLNTAFLCFVIGVCPCYVAVKPEMKHSTTNILLDPCLLDMK